MESLEYRALAKGSVDNSMEAHELRLQHFAKALARAVAVPEVASYLKEEIGKKFDGDYDALWMTVKDQTFAGKGSLRSIIASNLKGLNGVINSMADVEQVPKLQIALPVRFEEWDGVTPIKVAYTPLTTREWEVVYAYDAAGKEYALSADIPPDYPIMVVSINERTDDEGNVTINLIEEPIDGGDGTGGSTSSGDKIRIKRFKLETTYKHFEYWPQGDLEITWSIWDTDWLNGESIIYTNLWNELYNNFSDYLSPPPNFNATDLEDVMPHNHADWEWHWWGGEYHTNKDWQTHNFVIRHTYPNPYYQRAPYFNASSYYSVSINFYERDDPYPYNYTYMGTTLIVTGSSGIVDGIHYAPDQYNGELWFKIDYDTVD